MARAYKRQRYRSLHGKKTANLGYYVSLLNCKTIVKHKNINYNYSATIKKRRILMFLGGLVSFIPGLYFVVF